MKKVRLKGEHLYVTVNEVYDVIKENELYYTVIDNYGDENDIRKHYFEEVKEPNYVMVRDSDNDEWGERILLHDLGEQFEYRYITVGSGYEDSFINKSKVRSLSWWRQMKPINEVEQEIKELEQKLAELKQQINK